MKIEAFNITAKITVGARQRQLKDHEEWLDTFRQLVETVPTEVVDLFGHLPSVYVTLKDGTKKDGYGILILLTVSDYLFWKNAILNEGLRFTKCVKAVQNYMLRHLAKSAEKATSLEPEERKALLQAIESALDE